MVKTKFSPYRYSKIILRELVVVFENLGFRSSKYCNPTQWLVESGGNCGLQVEILTVTSVSVCGASQESSG